MSPEFSGALAGAVLGLAGYAALRMVAGRIEAEGASNGRRTAGLLRMVGLVDLVILTLLGAYLGPLVLGS